MKSLNLPPRIKVRVIEGGEGKFVAELPEYNIHTEADSRSGLDFMINDLIYAYFDVPKKYWSKLWYRPEVIGPQEVDLKKLFLYQKYIASNSTGLFK